MSVIVRIQSQYAERWLQSSRIEVQMNQLMKLSMLKQNFAEIELKYIDNLLLWADKLSITGQENTQIGILRLGSGIVLLMLRC